jgi:co-chaperonin GroES (HSP10)
MIKPSEGYVLVKVKEDKERESVTASGIVLTTPKLDREDLVVSVAEVVESSSKLYSKGETVYFNYFSGNRHVIKGKDAQGADDIEYLFVWDQDILGKDI